MKDAVSTTNIQVEGGLLKYYQDQSNNFSFLTENSLCKFTFLSTEVSIPHNKSSRTMDEPGKFEKNNGRCGIND